MYKKKTRIFYEQTNYKKQEQRKFYLDIESPQSPPCIGGQKSFAEDSLNQSCCRCHRRLQKSFDLILRC